MKAHLVSLLLLLMVTSCGQVMKDRSLDKGANESANFLLQLNVALGTYDTKIDSIKFVSTESQYRYYDVYHHYKDHPVKYGNIVIYPDHIFHTKIDTTEWKLVAFKRDNLGWVED